MAEREVADDVLLPCGAVDVLTNTVTHPRQLEEERGGVMGVVSVE